MYVCFYICLRICVGEEHGMWLLFNAKMKWGFRSEQQKFSKAIIGLSHDGMIYDRIGIFIAVQRPVESANICVGVKF